MKQLLILEELAQFLLSIVLFSNLDYEWWLYPVFILLPDFSMVGYLLGAKAGAWLYNFFHHKLLGVIVFAIGTLIGQPIVIFAGLILFGHSAMDRIFGFGLKYQDAFKHTHLGWIGEK